MALVPDALINPPHRLGTALPDVLRVLESSHYGVLQLPPPGGHSLLLAVIADQVAEYAHRSEEHTSELQSLTNLVCRLLLEKKKKKNTNKVTTEIKSLTMTVIDCQ